MNRAMFISINADWLIGLLKKGAPKFRVSANALPIDAIATNAVVASNMLNVRVESKAFPDAGTGPVPFHPAITFDLWPPNSPESPATKINATPIVLTLDQIRELLYDCQRTPGCVLTAYLNSDGSITREAKSDPIF